MTEPRLRVLFVDDERLILEAAKRSLRREFEISTAIDGTEALTILKTRPIDAVLADFAMPGMTGGELLERVALLWPDVIRLLVTAHFERPEVTRLATSGIALSVLAKPWKRDDVIAAVANARRLRAERLRARGFAP